MYKLRIFYRRRTRHFYLFIKELKLLKLYIERKIKNIISDIKQERYARKLRKYKKWYHNKLVNDSLKYLDDMDEFNFRS